MIHITTVYQSSESKIMVKSTYEVLHDLRVVSMEDGCSKPTHVELDISLSCLYVLRVGKVHWLSPVSSQ